MSTKSAGDDGQPEDSKKLRHLKRNKDHVQQDFNPTIHSNDNIWNDDGFGEKIEESIKRAPANVKKNLGLRLPNATESLEDGGFGFKFNL